MSDLGWTAENTTRHRASPKVVTIRQRGPVSLRRASGTHPGAMDLTTSYKFVQQVLVYDMIVVTLCFGRSPAVIGFASCGRLATCNKRDYDPCPPLADTPGPAVALKPARATHAASHERPRGRRDTRYEGL